MGRHVASKTRLSMNTPAASPLDPEQLLALAETRALTQKLRLARGIALMNALSLGTFAFLSLAFAAFDLGLSPMGLALAVLAWNEYRGRSGLIAADPRAPMRLALNQLALLGVVLLYCAWNAYATWTGPDPLQALSGQSAELSAALKQLNGGESGSSLDDLGSWVRSAALIGYGAAAALSVLVQGWTAHYYRSLRPTVEALARAPEWARALK
jgi:hypothetical protein